VLTGLLIIVLITVFGSLSAHAGTPGGLVERLSTGSQSLWGAS
jgi:hypothetical protein